MAAFPRSSRAAASRGFFVSGFLAGDCWDPEASWFCRPIAACAAANKMTARNHIEQLVFRFLMAAKSLHSRAAFVREKILAAVISPSDLLMPRNPQTFLFATAT